MKPVTFETLKVNAPLFTELKSGKYAWWEKMKNNHRLYIEIRKDNQINVYYEGGSVVRLHYCSRHKKVQAFTHEKYLGRKGGKYIECADELNRLLDTIISNISAHYSQKNGLEKENWSEKYIQGNIITSHRTDYIDSEFAYKNVDWDIRVDLIEAINGDIRFVELKRIDDGRMLKETDDAPEVVAQVKGYKDFINQHRNEILTYYQKVWDIKHNLNLPNVPIRPVSVNKEPLLIIFNRWTRTTRGREEHTRRMENILKREQINYSIYERI